MTIAIWGHQYPMRQFKQQQSTI